MNKLIIASLLSSLLIGCGGSGGSGSSDSDSSAEVKEKPKVDGPVIEESNPEPENDKGKDIEIEVDIDDEDEDVEQVSSFTGVKITSSNILDFDFIAFNSARTKLSKITGLNINGEVGQVDFEYSNDQGAKFSEQCSNSVYPWEIELSKITNNHYLFTGNLSPTFSIDHESKCHEIRNENEVTYIVNANSGKFYEVNNGRFLVETAVAGTIKNTGSKSITYIEDAEGMKDGFYHIDSNLNPGDDGFFTLIKGTEGLGALSYSASETQILYKAEDDLPYVFYTYLFTMDSMDVEKVPLPEKVKEHFYNNPTDRDYPFQSLERNEVGKISSDGRFYEEVFLDKQIGPHMFTNPKIAKFSNVHAVIVDHKCVASFISNGNSVLSDDVAFHYQSTIANNMNNAYCIVDGNGFKVNLITGEKERIDGFNTHLEVNNAISNEGVAIYEGQLNNPYHKVVAFYDFETAEHSESSFRDHSDNLRFIAINKGKK